MEDLFHFAAVSKGLEIREKIKLILFAAKAKPNTYLVLKINRESLNEKEEFEKILKNNKIRFKAGKVKSYEEITQISGNKITGELAGNWLGYDLFKDEKSEKIFERYVDLLKKFKHTKADKLGGKLYGYPSCCTRQFVKEHDYDYLANKYSYDEYYKRIHDLERKFPWVFHRPHALDCGATTKLNKRYERVVKDCNPKIWQTYQEKNIHPTELLVTGVSDILSDGESIWPEKDGYEYELITKRPFKGKYYLVLYLSKKVYAPGEILESEVVFRHHYVDVVIKKEKKKVIEGLHHERKLPLLGRKF